MSVRRSIRVVSFLIALLLFSGTMLSCAAKTAETSAPSPPAPVSTPPPAPAPSKPAAFRLNNLTITPAEVDSGSSVTIKVAVTNVGELSGTYDVNLKIDDTIEATEKVTLAGGATQNITFAETKLIAKTYFVSMDDQSGKFDVNSPPPMSPPLMTPPPAAPKIVWTAPSAPVTLTVDEFAHMATYSSGGIEVTGYFYKPAGSGPFPAVIMLHGKGGLTPFERANAAWLASQGYVALAPGYMTPIGMTADTFNRNFRVENVDAFRGILGDGLEALKSLSYVAPSRLGVYGQSLGGYFSFVLGTRDDVKAVVSVYGAYAPTAPAKYSMTDIVSEIKAPVLMFHCIPDMDVPIDQANTVSNLLKDKNKPYEYIIYQDGGHNFNVPGLATYSAVSAADFQRRVIAFFQAKLQ